jgi:hypothetical protein
MIDCSIAVHWHVGPAVKDGIERFSVRYLRALRVFRALRGPPIAATRFSAMGTFRDHGKQVGSPARVNNSFSNWNATLACPVAFGSIDQFFTAPQVEW